MAQVGRIPVALADVRVGVPLGGAVNGANTVFTTPEAFRNSGGITISVYYNGQRIFETDDYILSESGGVGTGFNTITVLFTPRAGDRLDADYLIQ